MKKIVVIVITFLMVFSFIGCAQTNTDLEKQIDDLNNRIEKIEEDNQKLHEELNATKGWRRTEAGHIFTVKELAENIRYNKSKTNDVYLNQYIQLTGTVFYISSAKFDYPVFRISYSYGDYYTSGNIIPPILMEITFTATINVYDNYRFFYDNYKIGDLITFVGVLTAFDDSSPSLYAATIHFATIIN